MQRGGGILSRVRGAARMRVLFLSGPVAALRNLDASRPYFEAEPQSRKAPKVEF